MPTKLADLSRAKNTNNRVQEWEKVGFSDETMIDQAQKMHSLCVDQAEALNATN